MSSSEIIRDVCEAVGVRPAHVLSPMRYHELVDARRLIAFKLRENGWSYPRIGRALRRDHSTIYVLVNGKTR